MAAIDDLLNFLGLGPDNWRERLAAEITFESPDGNQFVGYWIGSPRTKDKKIGVFAAPKVAGDQIQDLGSSSDAYSITFYFVGKDNDVDAKRFFKAISETGTWTVNHPVHGELEIQPISVTENNEPVTNGNITEINSEWLEPYDPELLPSAPQVAGLIDRISDAIGLTAAQQFADRVNQASETLRDAVKKSTAALGKVTDRILGPLATLTDATDTAFNALQTGIQDTLNETVLPVASLGNQIIDLVETPYLASSDINARLSYYDDLIDGFFEDMPSESAAPSAKNINSVAVYEVGLSSIVTTQALISTTGGLDTRAQAVKTANRIIDNFTRITDRLDLVQANYADSDIDQQYFSQTATYAELARCVALAARYLLIASFDLRVERKFTLDRPRCPLEITITEYGSLGDNDINLDIFLYANGLKGKDILLLPAGREVSIYV
jgi:prophage DNA circulation protein